VSDIKIVIAADVASADAGLKKVQTELGKTAIEAQKVDSRLQGFGNSVQNAAAKTSVMTSAASSLKSNLLSIINPTTLLIGGLIAMGKALYDFVNQETQAEKNTAKFVEVVGKAGSVFTKASLDVQSLRDEIDSFGKGIGSKDDIVKHFNETLGKTVGKVTSVEQAERSLNANAEAYIYATTAKAVANAAYAESYDIIFKYLKNSIEAERTLADIKKQGSATLAQFNRLTQINKENEALKKQIDILAETKNRALDTYNKIAQQLERNKKSSVIVGPLQKSEIEVKELKVKPEKVEVENIGKIEFSDDKEALKLPVEFDFKSAMDINKSGAFRPFLDAMKNKPILIPITIDFNKEKEFKKMEDIAKTIMQLQENFAKSTKAIYENTIVGAAQAIGEGIGNIISGEGGIGDMFKGISKIMGSGIKQFGQEILRLAILAKLAQKAIPNPVTGIFAGLALIALGTAIENATQRNAFASGTTRFAGGTALVGERGPELVSLPSGSSVMPNNQLQAFGNGGINLMPSIAYDGTMFRIFLNRVDAQISRNG